MEQCLEIFRTGSLRSGMVIFGVRMANACGVHPELLLGFTRAIEPLEFFFEASFTSSEFSLMRVSHGGLLASAQKLMVPDENRRTVSGAHTTIVQYPALFEK